MCCNYIYTVMYSRIDLPSWSQLLGIWIVFQKRKRVMRMEVPNTYHSSERSQGPWSVPSDVVALESNHWADLPQQTCRTHPTFQSRSVADLKPEQRFVIWGSGITQVIPTKTGHGCSRYTSLLLTSAGNGLKIAWPHRETPCIASGASSSCSSAFSLHQK